MRNLFGCGLHPLADFRAQQFEGSDPTLNTIEKTMRLGTPFRVVDEATRFRVEVAKRIADMNALIGAPADAEVAASSRARIRTEVAKEFFHAEHGRDPVDARELATQIAKDSRPRSQTVAGYDLTFSPVKSVSTLWAVADPSTAAAIERAHRAAVADALRFIEDQALFTRTGPQGIRQVNVHGLVAAAFTHRDSRAGDPDLHTHVAVANKVEALDGRWLSIDGRVLFKAKVAASVCWWIFLSLRCWIAGLLPFPLRVTTSRNRMRCGVPTGRRSTPSPAQTSTPRSGSSTRNSVSSPPQDDATGQ
jgi:hypothetical protein